jgi:hypothetical protein
LAYLLVALKKHWHHTDIFRRYKKAKQASEWERWQAFPRQALPAGRFDPACMP